MAPHRRLAREDQFPLSISLVPQSRNPPLYRSDTARTRCPVIQGRKFWPKRYASPRDYANLKTVRDHVTAWGFVRGISFDLTPILIAKNLGIPREDQPSFPYALDVAPKEEVLARALYHDQSKIFRVIDAHLSQGFLYDDYHFLNLVVLYNLSLVSHTNTLTRSHSTLLYDIATKVPIDGTCHIFCHYWCCICPATAEDMEADAVEGGGAVPDDDIIMSIRRFLSIVEIFLHLIYFILVRVCPHPMFLLQSLEDI
ncbi:hypothetical protein F0562_032086 [Nyssa sinensis]|uniref:Uncharacterized protein n=1 Tax=Nyssa sinensis TaxID=561372 RepID=A0A5J5AVV3_9ASTE|nr:hypothetical protein F0562_032086 [Nyssa sinensis]